MGKIKKHILTILCGLTIIAITYGYTYYEMLQIQKDFDRINREIEESTAEGNKYRDDYISNNLHNTQTVVFLFDRGRGSEANNLLADLISEGNNEAVFAKSVFSLYGKHQQYEKEESIKTLDSLCDKFIEPCLKLSEYFIETKNYDAAYAALSKAENSNDVKIYSELYYLFGNKQWEKYDAQLSQTYAKKMNTAIEHKTKTQFQLNQYANK